MGKNEPHLAAFTLPDGVEPGPANKLINLPDLEIPKPSLVTMVGFGFFWLMVWVMIASVKWIATMGSEAPASPPYLCYGLTAVTIIAMAIHALKARFAQGQP